MIKDDFDQMNVRLPKAVLDRIGRLAEKYGRRSRNQVASEVIEQYLDFWEEIEQAKYEAFEHQRANLTKATKVKTATRTKKDQRK